MKNKGQTTVLFSLIISILLLFTLSALEVGRIYCGKMKLRAVLHSAHSSILADYNRELFERYHLLFMDPTYGTGSCAMVEEKFKNYLEASLNGEESAEGLYSFSVEEVALSSYSTITDNHMRLLKKQIMEYEKGAGAVNKLTELGRRAADTSRQIEKAGEHTERNATTLSENTEEAAGEGLEDASKEEPSEEPPKVEDPRDVLKNSLSLGLLTLLLPEGAQVSKEPQDFSHGPSKAYSVLADKEKDSDFQDVSKLVTILGDSAKEDQNTFTSLGEKAAFCVYVTDHFSHQGVYKDSVMHCEAEYILKGKDNDYDNLEAVLSDIIWMRMPVNYIYLLQDVEKQSEALTLATAICSATGTMPMVEIVKYLLLGCWSYGESIYEVRMLMHGEKLPFIKTAMDWNTDLKTLKTNNQAASATVGMDYDDYLKVMLARKESKDVTYGRMLDLIELNLKQGDEKLTVVNLCGAFSIQGMIRLEPLLVKDRDASVYEHYFQEDFAY
ncbi:MAG: pilus assembly protein [Lachnospiraceae bacterium]|nr:pilus assembly protein [Lachnospiraceae bacterium]